MPGSPSTDDRDAGPARALLELGDDRVQLGAHGDRAERDDTRAGLELAEEQDLVDQLADLVDLRPRALDELRDVLAGERRRLEKREQSRERRPQLVRDRGREARAELLVRGEVAAPREVDEPLAASVHVVRHDERDDSRPRRRGARPAASRPPRAPGSTGGLGGWPRAPRPRRPRTTTDSRLSSRSTLPRAASASMLTAF